MTDSALHVVGAARRSLFDRVRPDDVGAQGERIRGLGGMALAALRHPGVAGGETTSADAVVVGGRAFGRPLEGWMPVDEHQALAVACGVAAIRSRRTAASRTWALVRISALRGGASLEAMAVLPTLPPANLVPVIVGADDDAPWTGRMLTALGFEVVEADNDDPWAVLSAFDRALRAAETGTVAVVATRAAR